MVKDSKLFSFFFFFIFTGGSDPGQDERVQPGLPAQTGQTTVVRDDVIHDVMALKGASQRLARVKA